MHALVYGWRYLTNWYVLVYIEGACGAWLDISAWWCRWWDALCVCSVVPADTGWHNQVTETVKAQGCRLRSWPYYQNALFSSSPLKLPPPFWVSSPPWFCFNIKMILIQAPDVARGAADDALDWSRGWKGGNKEIRQCIRLEKRSPLCLVGLLIWLTGVNVGLIVDYKNNTNVAVALSLG